MKFFKGIKNFYFDNMKLVNKFWLNQIALSIYGFTVCIAISALGRAPMIIASALASLFFVALLYDNAWDEGAKDRNRVTNGRLENRPFHGAKVGLFAYIPTFIFLIPGLINTTLNLFDVHLMDAVETISKTIVLFFCNGTYLGFVNVANDTLASHGIDISLYVALVCLVPGVFAYFLGYKLGLADKQIKTLFGMKPALGDGAKKPKKDDK